MSKDIFIVAKQMAGKQNPIVSALLYDFCPAAAHWYVRGAEPEDVFDVVWKAFEDYATGQQFSQVAEVYGITTMLPEIRKYIAAVVDCRSRYSKDGPSPEITHDLGATFGSQFGLQNQLNHLGGTLGGLKHYIRVWRFLMGDWKTCMKMDQKNTSQRIFQLFTVSLSAQVLFNQTYEFICQCGDGKFELAKSGGSILDFLYQTENSTHSVLLWYTELTAPMRRNGPIMADLIYGLLIVILVLLNQSSSRAKRS